MTIIETILWKSLEWPGHESARLLSIEDEHRLEGGAAFLEESDPCRLDYAITCNADWTTRSTTVRGWMGSREIDIVIEAANGVWTMNGEEQPQVAGCLDVDLNFSPTTNLLPIRRLALEVGQFADVRTAWLRFPSFELELLEQRYTRLAEDRVHYKTTTGFAAELRVSPNGLVLDYETLWSVESAGER
ncbi:MAG TPA: putative glycolipid-binding domain-containing protein [Thermoanaerobaculia bacterium]|nr:putative glycolipid-binding domain-containing protein [Thermoanaerobaculia bacterium]